MNKFCISSSTVLSLSVYTGVSTQNMGKYCLDFTVWLHAYFICLLCITEIFLIHKTNKKKNRLYVLLITNFPSMFVNRQKSFHNVCSVFSYDISQYLIVLVQTKWRLESFVSMNPWIYSLRCLWWRQNRIRSDSFRILVHVIWLVVKEMYELATRFCKVEISH
jgi:hypothetical protein